MTSRLITLVIMVGLAWALFEYARSEDLVNAPRPTSGMLYPGFDPAAIDSIYLGMAVGQYLQLEREAGGPWLITEPTQERALPVLVDQIIDNLMRAPVQAVESRGEAIRAEDVGLEPPLYQIRFGHGGHTETLLLGEPEALGTHVYARRVGDSQIVLTTRNLTTLLKQHGESFVDPSLFRGLSGVVDHVRVEDPDGVIVDARRTADRWTLTEPHAVLADETRIGHLVRSLQFMRRTRVVHARPDAQQLRVLGLPDPRSIEGGRPHGATMVEVSAPGETPVRVWLQEGWRDEPEQVAVLRDQPWKVVGVDRRSLAVLGNDAEWYREHRMLPPVRERCDSVRLERDGVELLDVRRMPHGQWAFAAPARLSQLPVEADRVEGHSPLIDFLAKVDAIEVQGFIDPPTGDPVARLSIGWLRAGQLRTDHVDLYPTRADGLVPARTTDRLAEGLLLPAGILDLFEPEVPDTLRLLQPLALDEERLVRLVIHHPDLPEPLEMNRDALGDRWAPDDVWGRRYGLLVDLLRGFRGFTWQKARRGPAYPWRIEFYDAEGNLAAGVAMRLPELDEAQEAFGVPAALVALDGRPGVELVVHRDWVDRIQEMSGPQLRKP
jgi:hypothetical protein